MPRLRWPGTSLPKYTGSRLEAAITATPRNCAQTPPLVFPRRRRPCAVHPLHRQAIHKVYAPVDDNPKRPVGPTVAAAAPWVSPPMGSAIPSPRVHLTHPPARRAAQRPALLVAPMVSMSVHWASSMPTLARLIHGSRRESVQVVRWQGRARTRPEATFVVAEDRARSSDAGSGRMGRSQQRVCE